MATVTKTTVEVTIGQYTYRAEVEGNRVDLFRDGASAGRSTWTGQTIEPFPDTLSMDAKDKLSAAIAHNLGKAWRASTSVQDLRKTTTPDENVADRGKPQDAANQGQLGNGGERPARFGEAEVGEGGPGHDPRTGELGGQSISHERRDVPGGMDTDRRASEKG